MISLLLASCGDASPTAFNISETCITFFLSGYVLWKIHSATVRKKRIADAKHAQLELARAQGDGSHQAVTSGRLPQEIKDKLVLPIYFTFLKIARYPILSGSRRGLLFSFCSALYVFRASLSTVSIVGDFSTNTFGFIQSVIVGPITFGVSTGLSIFLSMEGAGSCLMCSSAADAT